MNTTNANNEIKSPKENVNYKKLTISAMLCAMAVLGSFFSFPVLGSKCAPVQHIVNILCAITLGPWYGVLVAFCASLIRNLLGLGSILAFPGSMFGAFMCGIVYNKYKKIPVTLFAEVFGTAILGGLSAYPLAILFLGQQAGDIAFYIYVTPFFISTLGGALISMLIITPLRKHLNLT